MYIFLIIGGDIFNIFKIRKLYEVIEGKELFLFLFKEIVPWNFQKTVRQICFFLILFPILPSYNEEFFDSMYLKKVFQEKTFTHFHYPKTSSRVFLLSSRNSGSHLFMYYTQFLTKQVWQTPNRKYAFYNNCIDDENNYYRGHETDGKGIYNEAHGYYFAFNNQQDFLILLVRNLSEMIYKSQHERINYILKTSKSPFKELSQFCDQFEQPQICQKGPFIPQFVENILTYEKWNQDKKILVSYQQLLSDLDGVYSALEKINLPVNLDLHKQFLFHEKEHRERAKYLAHKWNGSPSKIQSTHILLKKTEFTQFQKYLMDYMKRKYPTIFPILKQNHLL